MINLQNRIALCRALVLLVSLAAASVVLVRAQDEEMSDADYIAARRQHYGELGTAVKAIRDQLKASAPNLNVIRESTETVVKASVTQYHYFRAGSGKETEEKTAALPTIWSEPAKFKAAQDNFRVEADAFNKVVAYGDLSKIQEAFKSLGGVCKACHEHFREPD